MSYFSYICHFFHLVPQIIGSCISSSIYICFCIVFDNIQFNSCIYRDITIPLYFYFFNYGTVKVTCYINMY